MKHLVSSQAGPGHKDNTGNDQCRRSAGRDKLSPFGKGQRNIPSIDNDHRNHKYGNGEDPPDKGICRLGSAFPELQQRHKDDACRGDSQEFNPGRSDDDGNSRQPGDGGKSKERNNNPGKPPARDSTLIKDIRFDV